MLNPYPESFGYCRIPLQSPLLGVTVPGGLLTFYLTNYDWALTTQAHESPAQNPMCFIDVGNITHMIHVWYIYLHLP